MNKAYGLLFLGFLLIMGCGKPNEPESLVPNDGGYKIIVKLPTPGYAQDVVKNDSLLYMAQGEGGLLIVSVRDPQGTQIVSLTTEDVRGYSHKIALRDSVVYLAAGTFGITVVDISDPHQPFVTVSNLNMKPARNILLMGNYMLTATSEQGVKIADISYPTQPDVRGGLNTLGYAYGLTNTSDTAYLLVASGEMGLSMYDISNFQQGFGTYPLVGWCDTPGYAEDITIVDNESLAYMACGTAGLQILDYSDTADLHIVGSFSTGGYAKELIYKDKRVFITTETHGLQIIDVSVTTSPTLIGQVETDYALGLTMDDKFIYVADEEEGLIVISIPQ